MHAHLLISDFRFLLGYIYYPALSQCFPAFQRGPCQENQYLVLPKYNVIPECIQNPCNRANYVIFNKHCYELHKSGPCPLPELSNVIGVNETTLEIICTKGLIPMDFPTRGGLSDSTTTTTGPPSTTEVFYYDKNECFKGGKRWTREKCPQQVDERTIESIFSRP